MKPVLHSLCWLATLTLVSTLRADLTVVQTVEGLGQNAENTSKFKGTEVRVDASLGTSLIMDLKTGETTTLIHPQKTYLKVSGDLTKAATESIRQSQNEHPDSRSPLVATGKEATINGYAATEYTCTVAGVKIALWLTKDLPDYRAALKEMAAAMSAGTLAAVMQNYGLDLGSLPGFPIRTVLELPSGGSIVRTVTAVNTAPVSESEFQIPADYKELTVKTLTPPAAANPPASTP